MRECQICGLLFLGTDCPGCGSRMTNVLDAGGEGAQTLAQRGGLPGIERLGESLAAILDDSELLGADANDANSSLPFGVGGGASKRITTLPFGIGSNPSIGSDAMGTKLPSPEDMMAAHETETKAESEVLTSPEVEGGTGGDEDVVVEVEDADGIVDLEIQSELPKGITAEPSVASPSEAGKVVAVQVAPSPEVVVVPAEVAGAPPAQVASVEAVAVQVAPSPEVVVVPVEVAGASPAQVASVEAVAVEVVAVEAIAVQTTPVQTTPVQTTPVQTTPVQPTTDETVEAVSVVAVEVQQQTQSAGTPHAEPDMEQIYAEEEKVVIHDFSDDLEPSEVMVDLDDLAEPVSESVVFAPTEVTDLSEPELFPAQALELGAEQGMEELALASQGFQAMANSMWDEAAVCFQKLAKKHPTDARIMNNYGLALLQRAISMQGDDHFSLIDGADTQYEAAIMALRQAAHTDPQETTILFNLGNALAGSGRYDKALRIFNAFLERSPPTSGALNGRAAAYIGLGRFDEATRDLKDAISRFGDHPVLLSNLSRLAPA